MIKITKKISQKEKTNNNPAPNPQKITKQKSKNVNEKKVYSSRQKITPLKISKNLTESKLAKKKNHNSISSKEEVTKKLNSRPKMNKIKQNIIYYNTYGNNNNTSNNNNNNKLLSSNLFLTNDTDIPIPEEEKKILKKSKFANNINIDKIINLPDIETVFKKNTFKKTIIIDNEGNNNLHMNIKKGENDYKKLLNNKNNKSIFYNSSINTNTESNSLFTNDSKMEVSKLKFNDNNKSNNNIIKEKEKEIKKNIIDESINKEKNEEEKRIKEYTKIFNLLNTNIEQFKKMFNSNTQKVHNNKALNLKEKNNNQNQIKQKEKKIIIQKKKTIQQKQSNKTGNSSVNKNKNNNKKNQQEKSLKKNLSEKNLSSSSKRLKTCQNIFTVEVRNDIEKDLNSDTKIIKKENNNAISSFLESSLQDDFYQSLIKRDFSSIIFDEDKIMKDGIMSINIDEKGKDENIQDIQDSRIFRGKIEDGNLCEDNDINTNNKNEDKKEDKANCFIF